MDELDRNGNGSGNNGFHGEDGFPRPEGYDGPEGFDDVEVPIKIIPEIPSPTGEAEAEEAGEPELVQEAEPAVDWEAEAALYKEKFLRALADNENTRRRQERELSAARKYSSESILRDLILVLENLHLALGYADSADPAVKALADGVGMTISDCLNKMADHGFRELKCAPGDPFDPNFQEAVGVEPVEGLADNTVARMMSRGYMLHDRLLTPVKVNLVKNPA
ncbi:MAG: nucleotide exchange factor GrpE [Deltaproteobacteria bacterium]|jgi:molecular chaperone GrpE|nr:nucleotide exchange factor GrpE [Deltaproteobacteria bacterium]